MIPGRASPYIRFTPLKQIKSPDPYSKLKSGQSVWQLFLEAHYPPLLSTIAPQVGMLACIGEVAVRLGVGGAMSILAVLGPHLPGGPGAGRRGCVSFELVGVFEPVDEQPSCGLDHE